MFVHFVCKGNTYRSRLAESYLNSKNLAGVEVFSSGIEADHNLAGPIGWIAARIIYKNKLVKYMSKYWHKTSKKLLSRGDYTVFFEKSNFEFCRSKLGFDGKRYEIWEIKDLKSGTTDAEKINESEKTFEEIKTRIDKLILKLTPDIL